MRDVVGKAQVWIDGKLASAKPDTGKNDMAVALPAAPGQRIICVLIEAPEAAGLGRIVTVE